jgi:hypothetical protein
MGFNAVLTVMFLVNEEKGTMWDVFQKNIDWKN